MPRKARTRDQGWELLRKFPIFIIALDNLNIKFIFNRWGHSSAAKTPVKHEGDSKSPIGVFAKSKSLMDKFMNGVLVTNKTGNDNDNNIVIMIIILIKIIRIIWIFIMLMVMMTVIMVTVTVTMTVYDDGDDDDDDDDGDGGSCSGDYRKPIARNHV